jgi:23S rRNA pseudouridine2605 synthase
MTLLSLSCPAKPWLQYFMEERLQKLLAQRGIASRRHSEQLIIEGKVRVNGRVAVLGQKANPDVDAIEVDGELLGRSQRPDSIYILIHKPLGVVTSCDDPWGRPTVLDLLPPEYRGIGLHPVGRLDAQTTGALLLTNDGALTFHLTHPTHHVSKTYQVLVKGNPSPEALDQWRKGIVLEGKLTRPAIVRVLVPFNKNRNATLLEVILQEGRKRQIRLIAKTLKHPVLKLHRTHIGSLALVDSADRQLGQGQYRILTPSEISPLRPIINNQRS